MNKVVTSIVVFVLIAGIMLSIYLVNHSREKEKMVDNNLINKIDYKGYIEISYSSSGDSNGNLDTMSLDVVKKTLTCRFARYHYEPIQETVFSVSDEDIEDIIKHIETYDITSYSTLPMSEFLPMDAATTSISISCTPKEKNKVRDIYRIYYLMEFPEGAFEHVKELTSKLNSLKKEENIIKSGKLKVD